MEELLTPKEMAASLKVPVSWIYNRTRDPASGIPHFRAGRHIRFYESRVREWLENQQNQKKRA